MSVVSVKDATSSTQSLAFGINQGSVLGPKAFNICMKPLASTISNHNVPYHFLESHVQHVCRTVHMHLQRISRVRRYLTEDAAHLVHTMAISRIDYGNSLFAGITNNKIQKRQRLQNVCARVVTLTCKHEHISPTLRRLHWLSVKLRIQFKVLGQTYKTLNRLSPAYMWDMLQRYQPERWLRSKDPLLLLRPPSNTATYGDRKFACVAATLWNKLPHISSSQRRH